MTGQLHIIPEAAVRTGLTTRQIRRREERDGAVRPERLPNGYRGRTAADSAVIRQLRNRVDEGVPIRRTSICRKRSG